MLFIIENDRLLSTDGTELTFDSFKLLTGKNFDLSNRKQIEITRHHGHLHVHDVEWIKDCIYKKDGIEYKCVYTTGHQALLQIMDKKISALSSTTPKDWEIVK
jgi:hypothetical protein